MGRKQRIDSLSAALTVAGSSRPIEPPDDVLLVEGAVPHFRRAIAARPAVAWTDEAVAFAAAYANHMAAMFRYQAMLHDMPKDELLSQAGKDLDKFLHGAAAMARQFRQSLGLHDRGTNGEKRDSTNKDRIAREIEAGLTSGGDDMERLLN